METITFSPCSASDKGQNLEECVETSVPEWLEDETVAGFRVWQLAAVVLSILLAITIGICCCVRFRIPRTKQEIEADYIRKKIAKSFRKRLRQISDSEMDDMDLQKALQRIQLVFEAEAEELRKESKEMEEEDVHGGLRTGLNAVIRGMRMRLGKDRPVEMNSII